MNVKDIIWIKLKYNPDERGCLTAIESNCEAPFDIKRVFYMHDVVPGADRGGHAHRDTDQVAVAVHGQLNIVVSDGHESTIILLNHPGWGIYLPRMTWTRLMNFSLGAVCLVLASTHYDRSKSIRTWNEYLTILSIPQFDELTTGPIFEHPRQ